MAAMTVEQALAVVEAFRCGGYQQVCCGYPQGGGMDENGNGEPPQCCGRPFDNDDLHQALATLREAAKDAKRYRWLRENALEMCAPRLGFNWQSAADEYGIADYTLDESIDAAMGVQP